MAEKICKSFLSSSFKFLDFWPGAFVCYSPGMRILTRYCLKEELKLFIAALLFFSGLLLLGQLMNLLRLVLHEGVSIGSIFSIVFLWMPSGLSYAIPMSLLFAILIGYGQMAQQEELTAIRAAGVSPADMLSPAIGLGMILAISLFLNEAWISPPARIAFREKLIDIRKDIRVENLITPGQLLSLGPVKFSCQDIEPGPTPVFKDIFFEYAGSPSFQILAEAASVDRGGGGPVFLFKKGQILWTQQEKHLSVQFDTARQAIPTADIVAASQPRLKDLGLFALRRAAKAGRLEEEFEYHQRWSIILSPFFFALFAATLSMIIKRGNRVVGFILTLAILAGYYILLVLAAAVVPTSHDLACLMAWLPNALLLALSYFFYRLIFVT